jgi:23S rRNA (cytosine1962-C5)-methyltransferase
LRNLGRRPGVASFEFNKAEKERIPPRSGRSVPLAARHAGHGERFDVVVLDPSKQTRERDSVAYALKSYLDMNRLALAAVAPGGILFTCSCTGLVREDEFLETIRRAAWQAKRTVRLFRIAGAGPDHPFLVHVPEGRYLKAVYCRVS